MPRVRNRQHAHEIGHRSKINSEYDHHNFDDSTGAGKTEQNGEHATYQRKLVQRGTRIIIDELGYSESKAKRLLLLHGSVQHVLNELTKKNQ